MKAVHWLSLDTARYASGPRRLNDFTLLDDPTVAAAYGAATAEPFYLGRADEAARNVPRPLAEGERLPNRIVLSAYVRSYVPRPRTIVKLDGRVVLDEKAVGPHRLELTLSPGRHLMVLAVYDGAGRLAGKQTRTIGTLSP